MFNAEFSDSNFFIYFVLPLIIFFARISDVTIGTIRIIFVSRGNKIMSPILGFFEVLIWVFAITNIIQHLTNIYGYLAYAGGFATGNYIGLKIEERLAMGINLVRVFTSVKANELMEKLHEKGYGATIVHARGKKDDVSIVYTIVKRKEVKQIIEIIENINPNSFYSIEDIRYISHDEFSGANKSHHMKFNILKRWRVGK